MSFQRWSVYLFISMLLFSFAQAQTTQCPGTLASRLQVGQQARVLPGPANNVRNSANLAGSPIGQIPANATFAVLEGPVCADGYAWWRVDYQGLQGWTAEADTSNYWLEPLGNNALAAGMVVPNTGVQDGQTMPVNQGMQDILVGMSNTWWGLTDSQSQFTSIFQSACNPNYSTRNGSLELFVADVSVPYGHCGNFSQLVAGDSVLFLAKGFAVGEVVNFNVSGANGYSESASVTVLSVNRMDYGSVVETYGAAFFSWLITPQMSPSSYTIRVSGSLGSASLTLNVSAGSEANFGVRFGGAGGLPNVWEAGEQAELWFTGFQANQTVTLGVYTAKNNYFVDFGFSRDCDSSCPYGFIGGFEVTMDAQGNAQRRLSRPTSLTTPEVYVLAVKIGDRADREIFLAR